MISATGDAGSGLTPRAGAASWRETRVARTSHAPFAETDDGHPVIELPPSLAQLLDARSAFDADAAWHAFVSQHSRIVLHVCRSVWPQHDDQMDAYAQILEHLRTDDHRRLREFARAPRCRVSTWLVVVSRRVCLDLFRQRYGRPSSDEWAESRRTRRRLHDLVAEELDLHEPATVETDETDAPLRQLELHDALQHALADLPPRDLLVLKLRFVDDLAAQEIARLLGFPSPFHVYRRLSALFAELRSALHRRGVESAAP
jgi:RNA polymerase sigma factor (sigma-70 family)